MNTQNISVKICDDKKLLEKVERLNNVKGNLTNCPICKGRGEITEIRYDNDFHIHYDITYDCKCKKELETQRRLKRSGLEKIIADKAFDNFVVENDVQLIAKTKAMNYKDGWFYMGGQSGFGKTHLCTAIAADKIKRGIDTLYMPWVDVIGELKRKYYKEDFDELFDKYKTVKFLYIDDLFKVKDLESANINNIEIEIAYLLVNYRYNNNLDTVISSEFTLQELYKFENAIAGRIKEKCGDNFISIGKDSNKNWRINH